ncbi:iron donor protein CyaY [Rhodocyclus tenuis]|uniref:Iron-sulfur cluster assembly protein CyaY n=2 Tax=Rhodocyclus TaxID=1064 RepID=A0A6L5K0B5_RHOTE|nr:iron donor protein CyaY [Rhodocyclus gracilis]MQY51928.1 iron donor protein CyaY [Rhodocyclus gracilis]MRD73383.1 iron donor protein CyaY [Rhodocyclus gracilis]NJA88507.1 iron donor protein CyaY [Rhodocyclus gracilis]
MNESEFDTLAEATLTRIEAAFEAALDDSAAELDFETPSPGVIDVSFADGSHIIINRHAAAQEIWVAARSGGFHFRWDGSVWRDTRDGAELMTALSRLVSAQAGAAVLLDGAD